MSNNNGIISLREETRNKILSLRSILNILCKPQFEVLWDNSDDKLKDELKEYVVAANKDKVLNWMRTHPCISPSEMSWAQLTNTAKRLRVPKYSRLNKLELITECERRMEHEES